MGKPIDANGAMAALDWDRINWIQVEKSVRRLQHRIFMAKIRGDLQRMESLQRLLASSWSAKLLAVRKVAQENDGRKTPGIDGVVSISSDDRARLLKDGLSLQGYHPLPVRRVFIPKANGKLRPLGIPTMKDRIMQCLVKLALEPEWEAAFEPNSFGFRPGRSVHDAAAAVKHGLGAEGAGGPDRQARCRWILDADIKSFFDNLDWELVMKAVRHHDKTPWVLLYIERWLKAPVQRQDGSLQERTKGSPQGAVVSPLLANLFLHHAFDNWMRRNHPSIPFERYADDVIVHAKSKAQAEQLLEAIRTRLAECGLELHPEKTKVVYCQDSDRKGQHEHIQFDFLGYTFRPRRAKNYRGKPFVSFLPGVSNKAGKAIRATIREWRLAATRNNQSLEDLARLVNPSVSGWVNYYGRFYRSALTPVLRHLERALIRWACRKYKRFRGHVTNAAHWLGEVARRDPNLLVLWQIGIRPATGS